MKRNVRLAHRLCNNERSIRFPETLANVTEQVKSNERAPGHKGADTRFALVEGRAGV